MKEIVPGVRTWSLFHSDKGMNFNGWYVHAQGEPVIVDPPTPSQEVLEEIEALGRPAAILLTNKHHTRASEALRQRFDCPVWVHDADSGLMDIPVDRTYGCGDTLPGGLKAITLMASKTPGESAFLYGGRVRALIVGDAVLGRPAGSLSLLPPPMIKDPVRAAEGLRVLLEEDFEALLLGDGEPILRRGKDKLRAFVDLVAGRD